MQQKNSNLKSEIEKGQVMDFETRAQENLDFAQAHANDKGARDYFLQLAQIYATLAIAQQISRYPSPPSYIEVKR